MADVAFEAWLDRTAPIEVALPVYQGTATDLNFTVLDSDRNAVNLTGYALKFAALKVDTDSVLFNEAGSLVVAASGTAKVPLTASDVATAGECVGELTLWSSGDINDDPTHRVQFRFKIVEKVAN